MENPTVEEEALAEVKTETKTTRRGFFQRLLSKSPSIQAEISTSTNPRASIENRPTLSRREFLKTLTILAASYGIHQYGIKPLERDYFTNKLKGQPQQSSFENNTPQNPPNTLQKLSDQQPPISPQEDDIERLEKDESYLLTALERSFLTIGNVMYGKLLDKMNIEHGNKTITREAYLKNLKNFSIRALCEYGLLAPLSEEYMLRLLPSKLIAGDSKDIRWDVGIPLSTIFALFHNVRVNFSKKEFDLEKTLPLEQFIGGLFYWYLVREKGFNHVLLAHSMNNIGVLTVGTLLFRLFPSEKAEKIAEDIGILMAKKVATTQPVPAPVLSNT